MTNTKKPGRSDKYSATSEKLQHFIAVQALLQSNNNTQHQQKPIYIGILKWINVNWQTMTQHLQKLQHIIAVQDFRHYYNQIITHSIHIYIGIVRWIDVNGFKSKPKQSMVLHFLFTSALMVVLLIKQYCCCLESLLFPLFTASNSFVIVIGKFFVNSTHTHTSSNRNRYKEMQGNTAQICNKAPGVILQDQPQCFIYRNFNTRNQIDLTNLTL